MSPSDAENDDNTLNSTPASTPRPAYPLEDILFERIGEYGRKEYLVKWEGYPLFRASWEPAESFIQDDALREWDAKKERIAQGEEKPFDLNNYTESQEEDLDRKNQRRAQRRAMRQFERRMSRSSIGSQSPDREEGHPHQSSATFVEPKQNKIPSENSRSVVSKHSKTPKKGIARTRKRKVYLSSESSSDDSPVSISPGDQPPASSARLQKRQIIPVPISDEEPEISSQDSLFHDPPAVKHKPTQRPVSTRKGTADKKSNSGAARKQPSIPVTDKPKGDSIFANWGARKKQRTTRPTTSGGVKMFGTLQKRHMYVKRGRRERTPDPEQLQFVDFKNDNPTQAPSTDRLLIQAAPAIDSHEKNPLKTASPSEGQRQATWASADASRSSETVSETTGMPLYSMDTTVGKCDKGPSSSTIPHVNEVTPAVDNDTVQSFQPFQPFQPFSYPKFRKTCWFWKHSYCARPEGECKFAHFQCQEDALPPGHWKARLQMQNESAAPIVPDEGYHFTDHSEQAIVSDVAPQRDAMHDYAEAIFHLPTAEGKRAVEVRISGMEPHIKNEFVKQMEYNLSFDFTYMCMADDYKHHIFDSQKPDMLARGEISSIPSSTSEIDAFRQHLVLHSSGAVYHPHHGNFTMLVYPADDEAWRFLPPTEKLAINSRLQFYIHKPVELPMSPSAQVTSFNNHTPSEPNVITLFREVLGITPTSFFKWYDGKSLPKDVELNVILMFPPRYEDELALLKKFFRACGATVFTSWSQISRSYCTNTGAIVFHPTFQFYNELLNFHKFLVRGYPWNVFQIGCLEVPSTSSVPISHSGPYTVKKLFPSGGTFLLTDDVIYSYPLQALVAVLRFATYSSRQGPGQQNWRIVGRPGLVEWVKQLATKSKNVDHFKMFVALDELCSFRDPFGRVRTPLGGLPNQRSLVVSPDPDELPDYVDLWNTDSVAATEMLVNWYAGWIVQQVDVARKFYIVYPDRETKSVLGWLDRYQHLDVLTMNMFAKTMWKGVEIEGETWKRFETEYGEAERTETTV